jgi:hypothetical protein
MATQRLPFPEWLPDQPATANGLIDATNVIPLTIGYGSFPTSNNLSNAASESLTNAIAAKFDTVTQLFAGGSTKLFKFNGTTLALDNVSKTGNYSSSSRWSFAQFGNRVLASNNSAKIQAWTVNSSSLFADVSATAPIAKFITVVRDFVVAANISGTPNKLQWSDINDETNWTSGNASQSDYQIIADGGNITGITGGEFGLVFLERAIVRMSYIGSPFFFQFDTISRGLGCNTAGSVTQYRNVSYFLADDGFYSCDGTSIVNIGTNKVNKYFYDTLNVSQQDTMSAAIDPINNLVIWNYPNASGGRTLLIYNWQVQKWSSATTDVDYIVSLSNTGYTLEGLDIYGSIEAVPASLDDRLWAGGKYLFGGVDTTYVVTFTGTAATATITIGDIEDGYNSVVKVVRPVIDNGSATVQVASRRLLNGTITYGSSVTMNSDGRCPVRSAGRFHRVKVTPTGNWTNATFIDIDTEPQGTR